MTAPRRGRLTRASECLLLFLATYYARYGAWPTATIIARWFGSDDEAARVCDEPKARELVLWASGGGTQRLELTFHGQFIASGIQRARPLKPDEEAQGKLR